MENPLLVKTEYPIFDKVKPQHIEPALDQILAQSRGAVKKLLGQKTGFTWQNLIQPLDELDDNLHKMWTTVSHLNAVVNSKPLRDVYDKCLPKLSKYSTEIAHNKKLYAAIKSIAESDEHKKLDVAQKKILSDDLRDFKLAGVALEPKAKKKFAKLQETLAQLSNKFSNNLLDATNGWTKLITNKNELQGLPEHALKTAKVTAKERKLKGWLFTLEQPSYLAIMLHADRRELRQEVYSAYVTRASDQGPYAGKWDNSKVMAEILKYQLELVNLLGFANYAEYSLAPKMAKSTPDVLAFLNKLAKKSTTQAKKEYKELKDFARKVDNSTDLQPWDIAYYSEKLKQEQYNISQEELRPYFPEAQVFTGMFELVNKLYDIKIEEINDIDIWHEDVKVFEIYNKDRELISRFYVDLYARPKKQSGAWMNDYCARRVLANNRVQIPIAFLVCNFNGPVDEDPALFTHNDVLTLFHEFGHGLQHMLTTIDYAAASGINGVPWDAVELASQFMENWCWEKPILDMIARHYKTRKKLTHKLFNNMIAAKNFQSGLQMLRQLELSLFDFILHIEFDLKRKDQIQTILDGVRKKIAVIPSVEFNRFQHGFAHIFAGGYSAGYYSYKWAEVLSSDAFAKFEEDGIFNKKTGSAFLHNILEPGGSVDPMVLFKKFRGRAPKIDALLKHNGIGSHDSK